VGRAPSPAAFDFHYSSVTLACWELQISKQNQNQKQIKVSGQINKIKAKAKSTATAADRLP
jgi:hypothetical protein